MSLTVHCFLSAYTSFTLASIFHFYSVSRSLCCAKNTPMQCVRVVLQQFALKHLVATDLHHRSLLGQFPVISLLIGLVSFEVLYVG